MTVGELRAFLADPDVCEVTEYEGGWTDDSPQQLVPEQRAAARRVRAVVL